MKCLRCGFANDTDGLFCEECGEKLEHAKTVPHSLKHSSRRTVESQLSDAEDIIFKPKGKPVSWGNILGVIAIVVIGGFLFLAWLGSDSTGTSSTTNTTTPQQSSFPLSYINITEPDLTWVEQELYFIGTLQNKYSEAVQDVWVRLDFYKDKASTQLFDTRTVDVGGTYKNGAFSFQVPLNIYPPKQYWWKWQVIEAEGY